MSKKIFLVVILVIIGTTQITGEGAKPKVEVRNDIKGRLLTPEEGCGLSTVRNQMNRIVGGGPAKNGAWPWIALIGYKDKLNYSDFTCGGSLISSRHVLTAAHCFRRPKNVVRLGEHDTETEIDGEHVDLDIVRVESHKHYLSALKINDIAVVHLVRDVDFTDRIRPICLPTSEFIRNFNLLGSNLFVAGWGHLEEDGQAPAILQQVQVPVIRNARCREKYEYVKPIFMIGAKSRFNTSYVLCAGFTEGGKDACQGDSGGPLMMSMFEAGRFPYYQMGVVSYGVGCALPDVPGVYVDVRKYIDWIQEKMK